MVTIQSQNFGVEIEMTGVSRGTAASVIANYFGVGGIHFAGGTYQTYEAKDSKGRVWKCMRDGSITPRRRRGGAIVEADDTYRCEACGTDEALRDWTGNVKPLSDWVLVRVYNGDLWKEAK